MGIFSEAINNNVYTFEISLNEETSKTTIKYNLENGSLQETAKILRDITILISRHNLLQKPIIILHAPRCLMGAILDDVASEMPNSTRNSFSKLYIIDFYRIFEYDGYDWKFIP